MLRYRRYFEQDGDKLWPFCLKLFTPAGEGYFLFPQFHGAYRSDHKKKLLDAPRSMVQYLTI